MTEPAEIRRKRLLFRSWHRGTREADLILGSFAEQHLATMTASELDRFEVLLGRPDADLLDWITGRRPPPGNADDDMLRRLIGFRLAPRPG